MDIKTLSTIIGHVSSSTTLNIYAHVTDEMRRTAAVKIDQGISKTELQAESQLAPRKPAPSTFQAHKGQRRKAGTGCVTQINERLWEGRYSPVWPDGKKHSRNVYAKTREECEALLPGLIAEMKAEIQAVKESGNMGAIPDGISSKRKQIAAYMRKHPEVTNKSQIAREVGVDRNTVVRYYNQIRNEL